VNIAFAHPWIIFRWRQYIRNKFFLPRDATQSMIVIICYANFVCLSLDRGLQTIYTSLLTTFFS